VPIGVGNIETIHRFATAVALTSRDHGPRHWRDVARVGLALSAHCDSALGADAGVTPRLLRSERLRSPGAAFAFVQKPR
jgi:hypothetical protein